MPRFILDINSTNPRGEQQIVDQVYRALGWIYGPDQVTLLDGNYQRLHRSPDRGGQQASGLLVDEIAPDA